MKKKHHYSSLDDKMVNVNEIGYFKKLKPHTVYAGISFIRHIPTFFRHKLWLTVLILKKCIYVSHPGISYV